MNYLGIHITALPAETPLPVVIAKITGRCYKPMEMVIRAYTASTKCGIDRDDCNESAETYHWPALV